MQIGQDIREIRAKIKKGEFSTEAQVSLGIVMRLLNSLGWPTFDTSVVFPEFKLGGRRVDYALCNSSGSPIAFIEVKNIGQSQGAERQLFEYAFHSGVQLAILTDGREWNFFLPAEPGSYSERSVYKLDIAEREIDECEYRLKRYLDYQAVLSGTAINKAREDYRDVTREREVQSTLPKAWSQLIESEDDILLELVADQVENLCGYKPKTKNVAIFLRNTLTANSSITPTLTQTETRTSEQDSKPNRTPRLRRGAKTPQEEFKEPILKALIELGGEGKTRDVLQRVERLMRAKLLPIDYEKYDDGLEKWDKTAQWTRIELIDEGLMDRNAPRGIWKISELGCKAISRKF